MKISVKTPGKLVIFGEYAVLTGAPAIAGAVNRWVHVSLEAVKEDRGLLTLPHAGIRVPFSFKQTAVPSGAAAGSGPGAAAIRRIDSIVAHILPPECGESETMQDVHLTVDSSACYVTATGTKLGLGSSAAVTVGLTAALNRFIGAATPDPSRLMEASLRQHRLFQGNVGSGIDIAASVYGGIIGYRLNADSNPCLPWVQTLSQPPDLFMRFVWSGRSASTENFIGSLNNYRQRHPRGYDSSMRGMTRLAFEGSRAFGAGDTHRFLEAVKDYHRCLEDLGNRIGRPIVSSDHGRIARMAYRRGVYYKPSGAGGGDFGILFSADPERLDSVAETVSLAGYDLVDIRIGAAGVGFYDNEEF